MRRTTFKDHDDAERALIALLEGERTGLHVEPDLTVGVYLLQWLAAKERSLRPTTIAGYHDNVHRDLIPVFGRIPLDDLRPRHVEAWINNQLGAGRGSVIVYRVTSTLRTELNAAVRGRLLPYNPAKYAVPTRPRAAERTCWDPVQAAAFLDHNARHYADQLAVKKVTGETDELLAFYDFPAEHWVHLRTTNPIESTFSTVKLRTKVTRGAGSPAAALAMVFKLVESAQTRWRAITAAHLVALVRNGARFKNGHLVERPEATAA